MQAFRTMANLGVRGTLSYALGRSRSKGSGHASSIVLRSRFSECPLLCRPGTSDISVFYQIFCFREYSCLDDIGAAGLIVDCGANVGYSASYFLTRFPNSTVLAVEPDEGNFSILNANLAGYPARCRTFRAAVWPREVGLVLSETTSGRGHEWARQVREARPGERPTVMALEIGALLRESGFERISILKIDIEGGELELFSPGCCDWLAKVDNLVVELHDDECRRAFGRAIQGMPFVVSQFDELTVCKRPE